MNYFINLDAVYHALLMVFGLVCLGFAACGLLWFFIWLLEGEDHYRPYR